MNKIICLTLYKGIFILFHRGGKGSTSEIHYREANFQALCFTILSLSIQTAMTACMGGFMSAVTILYPGGMCDIPGDILPWF